MNNHASRDYICPICLGIKKIENEKTRIRPQDLIYSTENVSVFINSFFIIGNEGHVIVVPNKHFENIYDILSDYLQEIIQVSRKMAKVLKRAYNADGITIQQNNEPTGGQHAFHFHLHVFPRFTNDDFYNQINN